MRPLIALTLCAALLGACAAPSQTTGCYDPERYPNGCHYNPQPNYQPIRVAPSYYENAVRDFSQTIPNYQRRYVEEQDRRRDRMYQAYEIWRLD